MENKKNLRFFVIMTNVLFWLMLGLCGLLMALGLPMETISKYAPIPCSWASFFVLMLWAKKLLPDNSRKDFIRSLFQDRIEWKVVVLSIGIPMVVFAVCVFVFYVVFKVSFGTLINTDFSAYPMMFIMNLIAGPMAEEPGWRGYHLINSTKIRGTIKGSLMTGLFWGLWHVPLWLMEGFSPVMLIAYAAAFLTEIISFNVVISCIYLKHRNLLYSIIMHQLFNFLVGLLEFESDVMPYDEGIIVYLSVCAVCNLIIAVFTVIISRRSNENISLLRC